jgi:lipoprotein-anchoring transpeptidase ErfK/SrfK
MSETTTAQRPGGELLGGRRRALPALVLGFATAAGLAAAAALAVVAPQAAASATPKQSVVAAAKGRSVSVYRSPTARKPFLTLRSPNADGATLTFLVKQRRPGWERVYLPTRPNGSTGWVRDAAVNLSLDPYRVVVSLSSHSLSVYKENRLIQHEPAGVGRSVVPTPAGTYFLVELLRQPNPNGVYGPYAFGLSAYSNVLYSFGGGPGQIGLHGTNEPASLGIDASHGCIRISNAGIAKLAQMLPLGTPVRITF